LPGRSIDPLDAPTGPLDDPELQKIANQMF
jgi:hypothetical protein